MSFLALACAALGKYADAYDHFQQAFHGYGALGQRTGQAHTHLDIGGAVL